MAFWAHLSIVWVTRNRKESKKNPRPAEAGHRFFQGILNSYNVYQILSARVESVITQQP
jgi:hypothetical protein